MLDSLHWSGGNTSLDALACGLPMVTLPGAFMRGRQSASLLTFAGVPELIARDAEDYVRIAVRLGREPAWRAEVSARLREGQAAVFDRTEPIAALESFFESVVG
jgi:predicted O-linked N-acetylglucosamine transferase (SPINDLY family)